jgi:hypothetical protein
VFGFPSCRTNNTHNNLLPATCSNLSFCALFASSPSYHSTTCQKQYSIGLSVGMWESELARSLPERQIWFGLARSANIWLLRRLRRQIFGSGGSVGKFGSCRGTAGTGELPASSAPSVNWAPWANLALSAQWLDKRRAHKQQKQTNKNKQTKTNKNKQKQTKTNKNKQKQTKTNKNKQKQTKTNKNKQTTNNNNKQQQQTTTNNNKADDDGR